MESLNAYAELKEKGVNEELIIKILAQKSRDNSRTPVQWDSSKNAGFSTGTPWIDVARNYNEINVEQALADNNSVFYTYQELIALRKKLAVLTDGDYQDLLPQHPSVWAYQRTNTTENNATEKLTVIANLSAEKQVVKLDTSGQILLNNYQNLAQVENGIELAPYQAVYLLG